MGKKKNGLIFNFSINGIPIISKDEEDKWHPFEKMDEHFEDDPNDIFHKDDEKKEKDLTDIAKSANATISELADNLLKKSDDTSKS